MSVPSPPRRRSRGISPNFLLPACRGGPLLRKLPGVYQQFPFWNSTLLHPEQGRGSDDFPRVTNRESHDTRLSPHFRTQYNIFLAYRGGNPPWPPLRKQSTFPSSPTSHSSTFPSPRTASAWKTR